jgi:ribulose-5-phosphate 4-epimerase/fuculose-1-phosphate aldolase
MSRNLLSEGRITRRGFLSGSGLAISNAVFGDRPTANPPGPQAATASYDSVATQDMASLLWDLVAANRILADQQVLDGYGHVSVRHGRDPNRYLLSRSIAPEITTAEDIMEYDLDSNPVDGRGRSMHSERFIHGEIYKVRPEVKSVVHFHAPSVVLMSVSDEQLRPLYHMAAFLGEGVPLFDIRKSTGKATNMLVSDAALGRALAQTLANKAAALMRGHGAVVTGISLPQAVGRSVYLKTNADMQVQVLGKTIEFLDPEEARLASLATDSFPKDWELWKGKAMKR